MTTFDSQSLGAEPLAAPRVAGNAPLLRVYRHISGPETTGVEIAVQLAGVLAFTALAIAVAAVRATGWSAFQWALAAGIAFDFGGGVVTNATSAAKGWFHRPGRGRARAMFYLAHVHPLVLPWAFGTPWLHAAALYAGMLVGAVLVERAPRAVANPVAFAAVALGLVAASSGAWPPGLEWFAPIYLLKIVGAHAVPRVP